MNADHCTCHPLSYEIEPECPRHGLKVQTRGDPFAKAEPPVSILLQPKAGEPTAEMVEAYLEAQKEAIDRFDSFVNIGGRHRDHIREACKAGLRAALSRAAPPVGMPAYATSDPEGHRQAIADADHHARSRGMVSVPLEPTDNMRQAMITSIARWTDFKCELSDVWRAILEAAP